MVANLDTRPKRTAQRAAIAEINFVCVHGGNPITPRLAVRAGWHYGSRNDKKAYAPVYMRDFKWDAFTPERWQRYLMTIEQERPHLVVIPDYTDDMSRDELHSLIADARPHTDYLIVVPKKAGAVDDIPHDCIVGISVPTTYAGYLPEPETLANRNLHLLGGTPDQWRYLMHVYRDAHVYSIDGNNFLRQARWGKFWTKNGRYRDLRQQGFNTNALAILSMRNAPEYLKTNRIPHTGTRIIKCKQALGYIPVQNNLWN